MVGEAGSGRDGRARWAGVDVDVDVDVTWSFDVLLQGCSSVVGKANSRLCCFGAAQTALSLKEQHVGA
jgi:hypothetical protein